MFCDLLVSCLVAVFVTPWDILTSLSGTVPTHFRGREYHTPLSIVFFKSYPEVGPFICLTPTDDMIIRPDHNYVLPNGTVDCNSIREFNKKADIMTVVNEIILAFGEHPPLFKKSPNMPPQRSLPPVAPPVATPAYPPPMNPELRQDQDGSKLGSTDENLCRICYDKDIETVLVPCGHQCACLACAQQVKQRSNQCPFCKNRIERIVKVYKT